MHDVNSDLGRLLDTGAEIIESDKNAQRDFQSGNIVLLKSGSVPMTVDKVNETGLLQCIWMTPGGELHHNVFNPDLLELASDNEQHVNQQQLRLLDLKLNLKKLEGFQTELQKKVINLASPQSRMPRKVT